jgi:pimeloyl-ACP methyl ester carboxylesterase
MPSTTANGITIEYETAGDAAKLPLLLIMGLGGQLIAWDDEFVAALADRGFYVIRFDNRDVGRSTWFDEAGVPDLMAVLAGGVQLPYLVSDMADDAAGLLEGLGIGSAHVFGMSMGGMIAQALAIQHPARVRTLTSVMSTTGDPSVGAPHEEAVQALLVPAPAGRAAAIEASITSWGVIGSPGYPMHEDRIRAKAGAAYDRAFHPDGTARQLVAIVVSPDRTADLAKVESPTLVIHGESDPLVDPSGGRATAEAVPGATLWTIPGMGHDLPPELFEQIADRVAAHAALGA